MSSVADLLNQVSTSFKYNLQVLPDTLLAASLLFSLLFQSIALATLFLSLVVHAGLHGLFAKFLGRNFQGLRRPKAAGKCTGTFPGSLYTRATATPRRHSSSLACCETARCLMTSDDL